MKVIETIRGGFRLFNLKTMSPKPNWVRVDNPVILKDGHNYVVTGNQFHQSGLTTNVTHQIHYGKK